MKRGYIVGAGAQGRMIAEITHIQHPSASLLFIDDAADLRGAIVEGIPVVGPVEALATLDLRDASVMLAIGDNARRLEIRLHDDRSSDLTRARANAVADLWFELVCASGRGRTR